MSDLADLLVMLLPFVLVGAVLVLLVREVGRIRASGRRRTSCLVTLLAIPIGVMLVLALLRLTAITGS